MGTRQTIYVDSATDVEIRPFRDKKQSYFFAQNGSLESVFYEEDTLATSENGIEIPAGQFIELKESDGQSVPQGNVWFRGASAPGTRQLVKVKRG